MPQVPTYQQTESLRPAFRQGIDVQASPDDFGAAIGRGEQSLGQGIANTADAIRQVQALQDETVIRQARNGYMQGKDKLQYDPETGYLQMQGQNAIDGFGDYQKKLGELRLSAGKNLTPAQRKVFDRTIEPLQNDALRTGMVHKGNALKTFVEQTAVEGSANFKNQALLHYNDPALWQKYTAAGLAEIEELGRKQGWAPEKLKAEQQNYLSDARRQTALEIANDDPIAAAEYAVEHQGSMTAADHMALMKTLMPMVSDAVVRDGQAVSVSRPGPTKFAATGLPSEAYALLGVISGTESPGYDVINGGERFTDFSDHPRIKGKGGTSTAAGRYQFVKKTWDIASRVLGLPDFSPISQDVAAWWLAQHDYKARTGNDLLADLRAGKYSDIRAGLSGTWEGIKKLSDEDFAKRLSSLGKASTVSFSPRVEQLLQGLPRNNATQLREAAATGVMKADAAQAAQYKADQVAVNDHYKLRIATDDNTLTEQEILDDPTLDEGDKASLINSLAAKQGQNADVAAYVAAFSTHSDAARINPFDSSEAALNNKAFAEVMKAVPEDQQQTVAEDWIRSTGNIPTSVVAGARQGLNSTGVASVADGMELSAKLYQWAPTALEAAPNGKDIQDAALAYNEYVYGRGLTSQEAAARWIALHSPEALEKRARLKEPAKDFLKTLSLSDVTSAMDTSILPFTKPSAGLTQDQQQVVMADYSKIAEEKFIETGGDADLAKKLALADMSKLYGVSDVSGSDTIMKFPPEKYYPSIAGSHDYIREVALADARTVDKDAMNVMLVPTKETADDIRTKQPPRYALYYQDKAGVWNEVAGQRFGVPPAEISARMNADRQRQLAQAHKQHAAAIERRKRLLAADAAANEALANTPGPDFMKANAAAAAREKVLMKADETQSQDTAKPGAFKKEFLRGLSETIANPPPF